MKAVKVLTMVAMVATSMAPIAFAPVAMAQSAGFPSETTQSSMDLTCSTWLASRVDVGATLHDGTAVWSVEAEALGSVDGPPTPVPGTGDEVEGTRVGKGSATYSGVYIYGDPYRSTSTSQSSTALKSLFGDRVASIKNWSDSEYQTNGKVSIVTTYTFKCNVFNQTETYHPPVYDGGTIEGYYTNIDPDPSGGYNGLDPDASCQFIVKVWGQDYPPCIFTKTGTTGGTLIEPESWTTDPGPTPRPDITYTGTVSETNYTEGEGYTASGGPWSQPGTWYVSKVMVCSPPKKSSGTWTVLNGYTGGKCTKAWFNIAPWGGGSAAPDGSYIPAN